MLMLALASNCATAQSTQNLVGFWYKPSESGWGLSIQQQGARTFAVWFTYDLQGATTFNTLDCAFAGSTCEGDIFTYTGTPLAQITASANATGTKIGTGLIVISSAHRISLSYSIGAVQQTKADLEPQNFVAAAQVPACSLQTLTGAAPRAGLTNYTDHWWGGGSASDWGLQISHQGSQVFAGWYSYSPTRKATWLTLQGTQDSNNPRRFTGTIFQIASGVPFSQITSPIPGSSNVAVGIFEFNFSDGEKGVFTYSLPQLGVVSGALPLERFAIAGGAVNACTVASQAPNILFVIADDFGLDASPCHPTIGSLKPSMPNLQALCSQGVVFDNAWAYPVCTPTRASILTGRYGIHTNVMQVDEVLSTSFETILQRVTKAPTPYANAVIGKWHVSGNNAAANSPSLYGAQYYAGFLTGALNDYYAWTLTTNGQTSSQTTYATTVFTDLAINWVSTQTKPWLLWLAYNAPHTPFHVPPAGLHSQPGLTSSSSDRSKYFAAAEALDSEMGRLLASLPTAVRSNTVVVFIGDNGTPQTVVQAPFSRTRAKDSLYEGGIHVPMVVTGAGVTRQGQRNAALINSTDLFATFSEIAKSSTSNPADSVSFAQALSSAAFSGRSHAYMDFRNSGVISSAVRDAQFKLIDFGSNNRALYNLQSDPYEVTNLLLPATAAIYTSTVNALLAKVVEFQK